MKPRFHVTYDITLPGNEFEGDSYKHGFVTKGNWKTVGREGRAYSAVTLREAIDLVGFLCSDGISSATFYEADPYQHPRTGEWEQRALHCPLNITGASYRRVVRVLQNRKLLGAAPVQSVQDAVREKIARKGFDLSKVEVL